MARRRSTSPRQHAKDGAELFQILVEDYPTRGLVIREQPALAVLFEAKQELPNTPYQADRQMIAVYGAEKKSDPAPRIIGSLGLDVLERHPEGVGMVIRTYRSAPGTKLSAEQVKELRLLARREPQRPKLSRPSALAERL